jgi:hypothetical protein
MPYRESFESRSVKLSYAFCQALMCFVTLCSALIRSLRFNQIVKERQKLLSSLKHFGALAKCSALRKAFLPSRCCDKAMFRYDAALWAVSKRHQSAVGVNYAL